MPCQEGAKGNRGVHLVSKKQTQREICIYHFFNVCSIHSASINKKKKKNIYIFRLSQTNFLNERKSLLDKICSDHLHLITVFGPENRLYKCVCVHVRTRMISC